MHAHPYSVPLAGPISDTETDQGPGDLGGETPIGFTPNPDPGGGPIPPIPIPPIPEPGLPKLPQRPWFPKLPIDPEFRLCFVDLPDGCYRITFTPTLGNGAFHGTVRVDRDEGPVTVSGDLYFFPTGTDQSDLDPLTRVHSALIKPVPTFLRRLGIPIYPRSRYHSYLKATAVRTISVGRRPCSGSFTFEQYDYTQPPAGSFNGSFPASPGSRTVTLSFAPKPAPSFQWRGNYYEGEWYEGGVSQGTVALGWVSSFFRRCNVEIDTLVDAVSPQPVPALGGTGTENFATMLASAGWSAAINYDQTGIPKPATVANHKACWSDADLHALMQTVRNPTTDLDTNWRMHVLVVPGTMPCSRGKIYDMIDVPREGVVSYSDDGYPSSHSSFFGAAENRMQRDVPRAFLRSASHEVVHGFNQIHQEQEGGADNSIMTTTPSVADVLQTAATGDPGVFPDDIQLRVNTTVRHHLVHFPDPVVRPGGHTFASWGSATPSADRWEVGPEHLMLNVEVGAETVALGEPVQLRWTLANTSGDDASVPSEVTAESTYARVTVIDAAGRRQVVTPFVIECERASIKPLAPDASLSAEKRVFWSGNGFAFEQPGRYTVEVAIDWTVADTPLTVKGDASVFVEYPTTATDNQAAANLLHPEVGKWVALGGGAYHLSDAVTRLQSTLDLEGLAARDVATDSVPSVPALRGFAGMLPEPGAADRGDGARRGKTSSRAARSKKAAKAPRKRR